MYGQIITVGIIVSLVFSELTGLSAAGLIVPGYIALSLGSPLKLLWTLINSLITLLAYRGISRYTILYGRRRFAIMVILSLCIGWLMSLLPLRGLKISVIGYLIPGIIAKELDRQGIVKTLLSLALVSGITVMISLLLGAKIL